MNKKLLIIIAVAVVVLVCAFFVLRNIPVFESYFQGNRETASQQTTTVENATLEEIETKLDTALDAKLAELE